MVTQEPPRCCGYFNIRSVVLGVAVYYVFMSLQTLVWHTVAVVKCGGQCSGSSAGPVAVMYSLGFILLLLSLSLLFGVLRRRPGLLLPFLAFQIIDFLGSLLLFCGFFVRFPAELRMLSSRPYLPGQPQDEGDKPAVAGGSFLFMALYLLLLLLKIYLIRCVLTYYRYLLSRPALPPPAGDGLAVIVVPPGPEKSPLLLQLLPSYEEAITMPRKDSPPPPYCPGEKEGHPGL